MNTLEIQEAGKKIFKCGGGKGRGKSSFVGSFLVCAADELEQVDITVLPFYIIVNNHPSYKVITYSLTLCPPTCPILSQCFQFSSFLQTEPNYN